MPDASRIDDSLLLRPDLAPEDAVALATGSARASLCPDAREACRAAHSRMAKTISEERLVYGLTTGFGPLANRLVPGADIVRLQQNLIHHLASGVGDPFEWKTARAIVLARLLSILQGVSGASEALIDLLVALLNSRFAPMIPTRGTVGASGDLTPLAHVALCLQARAPFLERSGATVPAAQVFDDLGCAPLSLRARDGLALVNGTSAMTGTALLNMDRATRLSDWSLILTAGLGEVMAAREEAWDPAFAKVRPHPGQSAATARLAQLTAGSMRLDRGRIADRRLAPGLRATEAGIAQDAYTLRCAPQVIGAALDTIAWHKDVTTRELQAATDNPIFPPGAAPALHGGNFMGSQIALASDALSVAVLTLAGLAERQVARVTDERLNGGLPAFLSGGEIGLNSGLMGAQVTATAILAEMRTRAVPASAQSISTNGANQDVVSMGTIAARQTATHLGHLSEIMAILALSVAQGISLAAAEAAAFSPTARALLSLVRKTSPALDEDRPLSAEITALARVLLDDQAAQDGILTASSPRADPLRKGE